MQITLNDKTYVAAPVKARMFREAISISELINFEKLKAKDLDTLVDFTVRFYGNAFTRDEFYDGLDGDKLISTLSESMNGIVGGVTEKFESKNG
jgi:hypothetical protein